VRLEFGIAFAAATGLLLAVFLVGHYGFRSVGEVVLAARWGLVWVSLCHIVTFGLGGLAWQALLSGLWRGSTLIFFWARWVRESVNDVLPVAQIGGELVGARVLVLHGASSGLAGGSIVVDKTVEIATQFVFTVMGLALMVDAGVADSTARWLAFATVLMIPAIGGFYLAQRFGLFRVLERWVERCADNWTLVSMGRVTALHDTILVIYRNRRGLARAGFWHLLAWIVNSGEVWLALDAMGHPVGWREAIILESLGQAVRSVAFAVPGALGVQEGGFLLIGGMFGLSPEMALAMSLIKRMREIGLSIPALLGWQISEGRLWLGRAGRPNAREEN
jgi:putative membrane protein